MLNLVEDKARISELINDYLKENTVQERKFEILLTKLINKKLQIDASETQLQQLGNIYKEEIVQGIKEGAIASEIQLQQGNEEQQQSPTPSFSSLDSNENLIALANKFGIDGHLDLMVDKIPKRYEKYLKSIKNELSLNLKSTATIKERDILINISKCNSATDVENLLEELYSNKQLTTTCKYIRFCLASAQQIWEFGQLLKGSHGEDWYRMHVYSDIFDKAFINDEEFETKRSECYSNITKLFKDERNQRIDFILRNLNDETDYITTEEKPGRKGVKSDLEKGKILQKLMLKDWSHKIGSKQLINKFEAITCQWEGTKLSIFATRTLSEENTITYKKGVFSMPKSFNHIAEFSKLVLSVLSLRRLVLKNYEKLNMILKEKQREEVEMLNFDDSVDDLNLRSDSTFEGGIDDDIDVDTMDPYLEEKLLKAIDDMKDEADLKSYCDWEEFTMEKVKRRRRQ